MQSVPNVAQTAALIGDPSRAAMLTGLLGGKALPATELARIARVTPQTASSHLSKMVDGGLLVHETYGRHRYYRLSNPEVAQILEALSTIAPLKPVRSLREADHSKALRYARTCYDHIAGEVGVALTNRFLILGYLQEGERDFELTPMGTEWFEGFGISLVDLSQKRRQFARKCLDWSERRHHVAGALGAAFTNRLFELAWIQRVPDGRAVRVTENGLKGFQHELGLSLVSGRS